MKLGFVSVITFCTILLSCGESNSNKTTDATSQQETKTTDLSSNPDYQKGLELVGKSDCLGCHQIESKLVGPSYVDVANKYASNPETITRLANTIIKGVSSDKAVWGQLPMSAHLQLSQADAEQMVKYILLLKK